MNSRPPLIIDVHGHYTTAPKALEEWRNQQIAGIADPAQMPKAADLKISDDELRETIETNQLAKMKELEELRAVKRKEREEKEKKVRTK